ncbi:MAG TPA: hypothetical protein VFT22_25505 [Kofleriaceae bacterium]|nr:hypothetical protein [Kofleriaceae bacterium]
MSGRALPWVLAGGAAVVVAYFATRSARRATVIAPRNGVTSSRDPEPRNAGLTYRPIGASGEPYPDWIRALDGKSGVYVIREIQGDGSTQIVYVGESHTGRLYDTLTRHFQQWRRSKKFWSGQYGGQGHDPGLTYPRHRVTVAARVLPPARALTEEARLISKLRPRDNLLGQPADEVLEEAPF